jgi:formyltetrahydrofolate deformylase
MVLTPASAAVGTHVLLMNCPDRGGIVAAVTRFLADRGGNIVDLEQHVDREERVFFMRVAWEWTEGALGAGDFEAAFENQIAGPFAMSWRLHGPGRRLRLAVFVSRLSHCLHDILARLQSGEWQAELPLVIGNHPDLRPVVERQGVAFHYLPTEPDRKADTEARQLALLEEQAVDLVVLARYMQILSPEFVQRYQGRIINIHHSFLPAFPGARPYHSAHRRGVKIIGATSHYVTAELDAGPIIEQEVVQVSHRDDVEDLIRKGRDLERLVLARAVWRHLEHKVLVYGNRTVVFD